MGRRLFVAPLLLASLAMAPLPALARDDVDASARSTARQLGQEAVKFYEGGDYAGALEKFNTAYALLPSPTLGLYSARCLVKLDRLVEASERYLEVTRLTLDRNAPKVMRKAQVDAANEREKLLPTIPSLEILLEGARGSGVDVTVDSKPLLPGLLGEKRKVNPGRYRIEAKRADATVVKEINLTYGESARVVLELPPLPAPPEPRMPAMRKAGWAAIGVAGAGAITGAVAAAIAYAKGQSLLTKCPSHVCTSPTDLAAAGPYDAARGASTAGFVIGGVALAAGVPLLVLSPKVEWAYPDGRPAPPPKDATAARLEPFVTPTGAGLRGTF